MEKVKKHLTIFALALLFGLGAYAFIHLLDWVLRSL